MCTDVSSCSDERNSTFLFSQTSNSKVNTMAFFLDAGTDLFGSKQNTRLEFSGCPTLSELIIACEAHFDKEGLVRRPAGAPDVSFKIQTMQVWL